MIYETPNLSIVSKIEENALLSTSQEQTGSTTVEGFTNHTEIYDFD